MVSIFHAMISVETLLNPVNIMNNYIAKKFSIELLILNVGKRAPNRCL